MSQPMKSRQAYHTRFISHCQGAREVMLFSLRISTIQKHRKGARAKSSQRADCFGWARTRSRNHRKGKSIPALI